MLTTLTLLMTALPQQVAGAPATIAWGDYDADGLQDALVTQPGGEARLLKNLGDGTLENVTDLLGLPRIAGARAAAWADYDADGRLDLFVASTAGESVLLRQAENGLFMDASASAGPRREAQRRRGALGRLRPGRQVRPARDGHGR